MRSHDWAGPVGVVGRPGITGERTLAPCPPQTNNNLIIQEKAEREWQRAADTGKCKTHQAAYQYNQLGAAENVSK